MGVSINQIRLVLELLYFLSGPLIVFIVILGLKQLKTSKDNARTTAKRESYSVAAEQCRWYGERIVPLINRFDEVEEKNNFLFFKKCKVSINGKNIRIKYPAMEDNLKNFNKITHELNEVLNHSESFSIFFTSGVADERVVFHSIAPTFCKNIKHLLPFIMLMRTKDKNDYKPIIDLFLIWNQRLEEMSLLDEKEKIESKLQKLEDNTLNVIGTQ